MYMHGSYIILLSILSFPLLPDLKEFRMESWIRFRILSLKKVGLVGVTKGELTPIYRMILNHGPNIVWPDDEMEMLNCCNIGTNCSSAYPYLYLCAM